MGKIQKTTGNRLITAYHARACELIFDGVRIEEIVDILFQEYNVKYSPRTIWWWVSDTGPLRDYYMEYAADESKRRAMIADNVFKANVDKAQGTLAGVMAGKARHGIPQFMAAKEWLDRSLGKVVEKTQNLNMEMTFADFIKEQTLRKQQLQNERERGRTDTTDGGLPEESD